ncbi:bi-domain-containing oxidoreductase [Bordetella bronchialis]|uniref:bi-domain-containing oxidoreductase n=1 Tax=Bordetella bronchialis TaxID=463025 RepID=UPI003D00E2C7
MKQVLQNLKDGRTAVWDIPTPAVSAGTLLIKTTATLLSSGTERMLVDFGRASLIGKARQQPERVRDALRKARTEGVAATLLAIRDKLDQPIALGYCNVGIVTAAGTDVQGLRPGDRIVSNGKHAEYVTVGKNLCVRVPDDVTDEDATFAIPAAIGLQGIRLASPTLGETFVVIGLGLIGLLTVQMLRANGCQVIGIDRDAGRVALADRFGAHALLADEDIDVVAEVLALTDGRGADGVLICASTQSNEPLSQAARMSRVRGRIVLVGMAGLHIARTDFYEKELSFQVSCSYGPGRYDPAYEEQGLDYPFGHVRWTENRNIGAALQLMAEGRLDPRTLITHRFDIDQAEDAYALLTSAVPSLGILITYPSDDLLVTKAGSTAASAATILLPQAVPAERATADIGINIIGAGNYAGRVLIPAFRRAQARINGIGSRNGVSAAHYARKYGAGCATSDASLLCADPQANAVVIATRHDTHARYVVQALEHGKHVFVEKPLCLTHCELRQIAQAAGRSTRHAVLMVGFNRRFAPQVIRMKKLLDSLDVPKSFVLTVNAGHIPTDHWTQDRDAGGGRIIGEGCHFIDLLRHLAGSPIESFTATRMGHARATPPDTATVTLRFESGSVGTINYFSNGHRSLPKERLEVFGGGRAMVLENFLKLTGYGWPQLSRQNLWRQNKGQEACVQAFVDAIRDGGDAPIPLDELMEVSRVTIDIAQALE